MTEDDENEGTNAKKSKLENANINIVFQNCLISVPGNLITDSDENGYLKALPRNRIVRLDKLAKDSNDINFNKAGFEKCFSIFKQEVLENDLKNDPDGLVSALSVAYHLKMKKVMMLCCLLMKVNVDKSNCLVFYNACKLYSQTLTRNELFHWLLINFCSLIASENSKTHLDLIDKELLLNLLTNESLVVTTEYQLYTFLKNWMFHDLTKNHQQLPTSSDEDFFMTPSGEKYLEMFKQLRLSSLLAYSSKIESIFDDNIYSKEILNETLFHMHNRILRLSEPSEHNKKFRIAQRFTKNTDHTFQTDFFSCGVILTFKFSSKHLSVIPKRASTHKFSYQGPLSLKMKFTLYGSLVRDQCRFTTEATEETRMELPFEKERIITYWRKIVAFPCTLACEIQMLLGGEKAMEIL